MILHTILQFVLAFFIGSIPFGIIVCESLKLKTPTSYGSGNIGASNVARQNLAAGALTLLLDASKGGLALLLLAPTDAVLLSVILGHCYSPVLNFNGGKGVATAVGALLVSHTSPAIILMTLWGITFMHKRTPALSSIICSLMMLIYALLIPSYCLAAASALIIIRHQSNIYAYQQS
jgi:acyl phosphate:glycerol-3-phosphate acyltransferase